MTKVEDLADVSIIIPTLNEGAYLARSLHYLTILNPPVKEIIVVDGGSTDTTLEIAKSQAVTVLHSEPGRALQMNVGAKHAAGNIFCFLHGDTLVPDDAIAVIEETLTDSAVACGGFISLMTGKKVCWITSLHNALKTYYASLLFHPILFFRDGFRVLFGDQVMFCRRQDFWACGGFDAERTIMEEADLCIRLSQVGRIVQVNRTVHSSARRVERWGVLKANGIYLAIGFLWGLGVPDAWLKRFYEDVR